MGRGLAAGAACALKGGAFETGGAEITRLQGEGASAAYGPCARRASLGPGDCVPAAEPPAPCSPCWCRLSCVKVVSVIAVGGLEEIGGPVSSLHGVSEALVGCHKHGQYLFAIWCPPVAAEADAKAEVGPTPRQDTPLAKG